MKKLFIIAAAASVTLASCVKNEPVATPDLGEQITFENPVIAPATKATVIDGAKDFPACETFNLYAWYTEADVAYAGEGTLYIENKVFQDKGTYWGGETPQYWPKNGDLTFVAYAPSSATGLSVDNTTDDEKLVLNYTVPTAIASQKDVLYSDWVKDKKASNQSGDNSFNKTGIDLPFHHALSAVQFILKAADDAAAAKIKIKGITLGELKNVNSLTVNHSGTVNWGEATGNETYTVLAAAANDGAAKALTTAGENLNSTTEFMLLPQNVDATLAVTYYMKTDGGWLEQSIPIDFDATWVKGTRYIYTIVFSLDEIKIAPVVKEDWASSSSTINQGL